MALSQPLGLSLAEGLTQHRESVTAIFIEACRCELRLPAAVTLPPLGASPPSQEDEPPAAAPVTEERSMGPIAHDNGQAAAGPDRRLTQDEARELKRLAHVAFGYRAGERRLRADLGFEVDEALTLRHLAKHVSVEQYATLRAAYEAALRQAVEADMPGQPETRQGSPPRPSSPHP